MAVECVVSTEAPKQLINTAEKNSDTGLAHYMNKPTIHAPL
jgi:hypothetical protein